MNRIGLLILYAAATALCAQDPQLKRGAEIFRTTCGVAYCHGAEGTASRAPRLAGRTFAATELISVISRGRPGTAMPGFSQQLKSGEIEAVAQYILSMSAPSSSEVAASPKPSGSEMPPAVQAGRALFFDAVRMGGCGKCHELNDRGSPVGPDLKALDPLRFRNLRAAASTHVVTASPANEDPFPALVKEQTPERVLVHDLSSPLPVLRTFKRAEVRIAPGSSWSHGSVVESYSDGDLEAISGYLAWVVRTAAGK